MSRQSSAIYRNATVEMTGTEKESRSISGYGIVFNSDSEPMMIYDRDLGVVEVVERISRESLDGSELEKSVVSVNHNFDKVIARGDEGTATFTVDEIGVRYSVPNVPNTTYGNDVLENIRVRNYAGSSFMFSVDWEEGYDIEERDDGKLQATPKKIQRVYEMGPVTNPAYPTTTAENRSMALVGAIHQYLERKKDTEQEKKDKAAEAARDRELILKTKSYDNGN